MREGTIRPTKQTSTTATMGIPATVDSEMLNIIQQVSIPQRWDVPGQATLTGHRLVTRTRYATINILYS